MMKKLLFALLVIFVIFVASCTKPSVNDVPPNNDTPGVSDEVEELDTDPTSPYSTKDIKSFMAEKYAQAKDAYFWFAVNTMPSEEEAIDFNTIKQIGDIYYYKVGHESIKNLEDLKSYLKTIFSDKIAEGLINANPERYIDIDGELWAADASRGTNIFIGDVIYAITEKTDNCIVYTANVEILAEDMETVESIETYTYRYEKTDNGWRWTQFSVFE